MKTIKNDMIVFFDVDDTLVMWNNVNWTQPGEGQIKLHDPTDDSYVYLKPHIAHINLLKKYKSQGYTVIVWSAGGYRWAQAVVKQLDLDDTVDFCMSKCLKYVDDLQGAQVLGQRVYIPFEQINKVIPAGELE